LGLSIAYALAMRRSLRDYFKSNADGISSLPTNLSFTSYIENIDQVSGPEGVQLFFKNDDTIGESLRRYGEWARNEMNVFGQYIKPGDTVLDIGCNVGTHSMFFSNVVGARGNVISFDAQLAAVTLTGLTSLLQNRINVSVLNLAVGEFPGQVVFPVPDYTVRENFGALKISNLGRAVQQISIDGLELQSVNFIKMDIEGNELAALRGAKNTIQLHRPVISCEVLAENFKVTIMNFLEGFGYQFEDLEIPAFNPRNHLLGEYNIFGPAKERVLICKPLKQ
jgi:FkbM family methyltransferase